MRSSWRSPRILSRLRFGPCKPAPQVAIRVVRVVLIVVEGPVCGVVRSKERKFVLARRLALAPAACVVVTRRREIDLLPIPRNSIGLVEIVRERGLRDYEHRDEPAQDRKANLPAKRASRESSASAA